MIDDITGVLLVGAVAIGICIGLVVELIFNSLHLV